MNQPTTTATTFAPGAAIIRAVAGPCQEIGERGTVVAANVRAGYCDVRWSDGRTGTTRAADLAPAPATPAPTNPALAETVAYWPHTTANHCGSTNGDEAGIDLFDSPYNAGYAVIYVRYGNGLRWPARSVDTTTAGGRECLASWATRGTVNDYRATQATPAPELTPPYSHHQPPQATATGADNMNLLPMYAKKADNGNVILYRDAEAKQAAAVFPRDYSGKPTKQSKTVRVNCCDWQLIWI